MKVKRFYKQEKNNNHVYYNLWKKKKNSELIFRDYTLLEDHLKLTVEISFSDFKIIQRKKS